MVYIIDTMNILQAAGTGTDKEAGFSRLLALFEQSGLRRKPDKVFFMIDGYPFPIREHKPGIHIKFSRDKEADELIIRKANALVPAKITVITSDRGIRNALAGSGITFMDNTFLKDRTVSGSKRKKPQPGAGEKPDESSDWFNTLYKLRMKEE